MGERERSSVRLSRRQLLGAATTVAGASLWSKTISAAAADESTRKLVTRADYDVIVVGGGFSGVTAARDLQKNGLRTLVLEAKGRIGGRTFDTQFRGHHIELGGTWVHWVQPAVWAEILRYGMEIEETPGAVPDQLVAIDGEKRFTVRSAAQMDEINRGLQQYFDESAAVWERPYDSGYRWKEIVARDAMSTADRLKAIKLTPLQHAFVVAAVEAQSNCPIEQTSYVDMLRWWALCLNSPLIAPDALARFKLSAGTGSLVQKIAADGKSEVRLSTPVRRIEQQGGAVLVTPLGGKSVSARAVLLAVPPRVLKDIEFMPALSAMKVEASRNGFPSSGIKLYAEVKGRLGKQQWLSSGKKQGNGLFWTYAQGENSTLMVGFCPRAEELDANDEEAVQGVLRQFEPSVEVLACTSYAWHRDPFAQGTYTGMRPGGMTRYFTELARPEGQIWMAGGDIGDNSWRGFIDGAIARGSRIAREISETLLT